MTATTLSSTLNWKQLLAESTTSAEQLAERFDIEPERLTPVLQAFLLRINPPAGS